MSILPEPEQRPTEGRSIIELEEKLSFQQRQLDDLNSVVLMQQRDLDRVKLELARLTEVLRGVAERTGDDLPQEKPPHY